MTSPGTADEEAPLLKRADEYFLQARFDEAIEACTRHIKLNPSDVSGYFQRAKVFSFQERHEESLADFDELLKLRPDNPVVFYHRGRDLAYAGYYEEAIQDFNSAEAVDPNFDVESIALLRAHCIENIPDDGTLFTQRRDELLEWITRNR